MKKNKLINKKGFTLIELLAVIVILALIALIATPIVLNIINDSKQKAKNDSVNGIIDAVRLYYIQNPDMELPATITFDNEGVARIGSNIITLGLSGEKPTGGNIYIDFQGGIVVQNLIFSDGYICTMASGENGCTKAEITGGTVTSTPAIEYITSKNNSTSLVDDPVDTETRMIFKGATPHNYINLKENNDDVLYRIVSIESDGTIKVIRDEEESRKPWDQTDTVGSSSGPRLNENNTYCMQWNGTSYVDSGGTYYGCNAWNAVGGIFTNGGHTGTVTQNASLNTYLNGEFYNKLDENVKSLIVTHVFDTGGFSWGANYNSIASGIKQKTWRGKIGLITGLDWFNATTANCTSDLTANGWYNSGKTNTAPDHATNYPCSAENYLYKSSWWWTLSPSANYRHFASYVNNYGNFDHSSTCYSGGVRPTFYLTSNINLTGDGTSGSPFEIN